jgi:dipeptidyl aminopeptidase/acylaminoacyl peptidase
MPTATVLHPTATLVLPTPLPTKTLMPYEQYTIDYLRQRAYGGGRIEILEKRSETDLFTSYSIRYPSDGLTIYGFVNIPKGYGPFPVIVSIHGYAPYGRYDPFNPAEDSADFFAANQFVVIHPGLRNQPPSDDGDNLLRVGMSLDVMNLIALLKQKNELPEELAVANPDRLGLWGTSMGGEIALRIMTISPDIQATVLFSPLSGNIDRNSKQLYDVVRDDQFLLDEQVPLELHDRISPMNYYYRITAAVQIHHGTADTTAPMSWAAETCDFLQAAGVSVRCVYYKNAEHIFGGPDGDKLRETALAFYRAHLSP